MKKNQLDEMQEQKMLKIEHRCFWIAFWGLLISIYFQIAIGNGGLEGIGGEAVVLVIISLYLLIGSLKNGLWDRTLHPTLKVNLITSLITGLAVGGFWFAVRYHKYHNWQNALTIAAFMFLLVSVLLFLLLILVTALYQHRKKKLEQIADEEENEEDE